jgi:alcohol dehydrogenase
VKVRGAVLREMGLPAPYAESRPLEVVELELAPPGPGELLVRVGAAGLCHSDLSVIDGSRPRVMPMVLGHEAAGEVVEAGPYAGDFAPGDHVVLAFVPACGGCVPCMDGRAALCEPGAAANTAGTLLSGERRWDGELHHHLGVSAFADHIVVSARSAVKVP